MTSARSLLIPGILSLLRGGWREVSSLPPIPQRPFPRHKTLTHLKKQTNPTMAFQKPTEPSNTTRKNPSLLEIGALCLDSEIIFGFTSHLLRRKAKVRQSVEGKACVRGGTGPERLLGEASGELRKAKGSSFSRAAGDFSWAGVSLKAAHMAQRNLTRAAARVVVDNRREGTPGQGKVVASRGSGGAVSAPRTALRPGQRRRLRAKHGRTAQRTRDPRSRARPPPPSFSRSPEMPFSSS